MSLPADLEWLIVAPRADAEPIGVMLAYRIFSVYAPPVPVTWCPNPEKKSLLGVDLEEPAGVAMIDHQSGTEVAFARLRDPAHFEETIRFMMVIANVRANISLSGEATIVSVPELGRGWVIHYDRVFSVRSETPSRRAWLEVFLASGKSTGTLGASEKVPRLQKLLDQLDDRDAGRDAVVYVAADKLGSALEDNDITALGAMMVGLDLRPTGVVAHAVIESPLMPAIDVLNAIAARWNPLVRPGETKPPRPVVQNGSLTIDLASLLTRIRQFAWVTMTVHDVPALTNTEVPVSPRYVAALKKHRDVYVAARNVAAEMIDIQATLFPLVAKPLGTVRFSTFPDSPQIVRATLELAPRKPGEAVREALSTCRTLLNDFFTKEKTLRETEGQMKEVREELIRIRARDVYQWDQSNAP